MLSVMKTIIFHQKPWFSHSLVKVEDGDLSQRQRGKFIEAA